MQTERQTQIVEMALEIISEKGIQGLTIKNISKKIGISEPAIYRHFKSKTAILLAILDTFQDMAELLSSMMETYKDTAVSKINFMFSKMLDIFSDSPALVSIMFSEEIFKNEEQLKTKTLKIQNLHQATVEQIIATGQAEKNTRTDVDKKNLALIIMGAIRLLVKRWELGNYNFDLRKEGKDLINALKTIISTESNT